ncbi:hypothetical protein A4X13_0g4337 [Tilletia indica]|uniref:Uncharacterized protein n=1 Tax=Tilletia indica TaxID=43049 RepID=A0A177TBC8_9BASI|nr:hypothetical protein A4X13_0g4337 [Tilletia indica]
MSDLSSNIAVYVKELDVKTSRTEEALEPMGAAASYLALVHTSTDREVDATIMRYNRLSTTGPNWQSHLVSLSGDLERYLSEESRRYYQYQRCPSTDLTGVKMFDQLRGPTMTIRSLADFRDNFENFGGSALKNMDWSNVGVAGGSVLACLTTSEFGEAVRNSDIDLFIWGLGVQDMQRKLESIKTTIIANVPHFAYTYVVERSAGAITFIPRVQENGRKIQVVLRAYTTPAAVLSSFDLDPACAFFDGEQVWLSLRAVRAFYTGYTTTVGAISSSFAARIVKYATRGYGVRVRPEEGDPDMEELLLTMQSAMRKKVAAVAEAYTNLPWMKTANFRRVFNTTKSQASNNWTHSFSALASLAALWNLAHATGRIGELMDEVGAASHIYGMYEG